MVFLRLYSSTKVLTVNTESNLVLDNETIIRKIFNIALPSVMGFLVYILLETVDIFWIGKIDSKAIAAVGAASFLLWLIYSLMNMTNVGCSTLMSQYIGANDSRSKFEVFRESFWSSLFFSFLYMIIMGFGADSFLRWMGLDSQTLIFAKEYYYVFVFGFPILYISALIHRVFMAHGDAKRGTLINVLVVVLNIFLDPLFIFGYGFFPKMGIMGAALATVLSQFIGLFVFYYYARKHNYIQPAKDLFSVKMEHLKDILSVGLPSATTNAIWTAVFPMLSVIITQFGMLPLAGLNIGNRIEGFPYFFGVGFSFAISTLVGQYYGAKKREEIGKIVRTGIVLITVILLPMCAAFIFIPEKLVMLINSDPEVIKHSADYLRIVGFFEIFLGWELVFEGAFNGLGNTKTYMLIRVPLTLLRVPLAYFFAITLGIGVTGVWWAVSLTTFMKGTLLAFAFMTSKRNRDLLFSDL